MKWVQLLCFSILLPCLIAEKPECHFTEVMEDDPPYMDPTKVCPLVDMCFFGLGQVSSGKHLIERGCSNKDRCDQERIVSYGGANHTMSYTCCEEALCNRAVIMKPSGENGQPSAANGLHLSMAVALVVGVVNVCMW